VYPTQIIEAYNIADLNWGTSFGSPVTLSFWFRSNIPSGSQTNFVLRNSNAGGTNWNINQPFTYNTTGTWQYVTSTLQPPPNGSGWNTGSSGGVELFLCPVYLQNCSNVATWQAVNNIGLPGSYIWPQTAGNFIEFTGVQLEKGTVATPFEFRAFAQELALCQRYYYQESMPNTSLNYNIVCPMTIITGTTAMGVFKYPVTMRSNAVTLTSSGTYTLDWYTVNANSIGALGMSPNGQGSANYAQLYATSVGNGSVGSVTVGQVRFLTQSTSGGYIGISAEL
jgi:hypothetical protein